MRLHVLELGRSDVDKGVLLTPGVDLGVWVSTPVPAYLLETDGGELVLIDCGLHTGHIEYPEMTWGSTGFGALLRPRMTTEHTIEHQLEQLGLRTDDVTHVVLSHLHFDHCGQLEKLLDKPVMVSGRHLEAARGDDACPSRYFDLPGIEWVDFDGTPELFPGLRVIDTPGHAPFHSSFEVSLPETGTVVLAIDAILSHHQVEADSWADQLGPAAAYASAHQLLDLTRDRGARLLYGHNPDQWLELGSKPRLFS